jgi:hypothetical protein
MLLSIVFITSTTNKNSSNRWATVRLIDKRGALIMLYHLTIVIHSSIGHLHDHCIQTTADKIEAKDKDIDPDQDGYLIDACCSAEPLITCFYKDKPSINPCPKGKIMDAGRKSFW